MASSAPALSVGPLPHLQDPHAKRLSADSRSPAAQTNDVSQSGMRHALYQLGFHDVYHMHTVRDNPETDGPQWINAFEAKYKNTGTMTRQDWDKLLGDCQAVADIPAAFFGAELAQVYPEAKVVILNRDPEKWYDSVLNSIHSRWSLWAKLQVLFCAVFDKSTRAWIKFGMTMKNLAFDFDHRSEKPKALAWYKGIYDEFRARIPESRRIEYSVGDGWAPLCKHLGVEVPQVQDASGKMVEAPFPRMNDRAAFLDEMNDSRGRTFDKSLENMFRLIGKATVAGSTAYVGYWAWTTRLGGRL